MGTKGIAALVVAATAAASVSARADTTDTTYTSTLGVMTDAGVPDGANASLVLSPIHAIRVEGGIGFNGVGTGARGGVTWIPLHSWVTPTLGVGYGRFPEHDANPFAREITGDTGLSSPLLQHFGYDFAVARAGLELGRHVTFFIHAGITRVTGQIHGVDAAASSAASTTSGNMVTVSSTDPNVTVWTVSADVGLIFHIF